MALPAVLADIVAAVIEVLKNMRWLDFVLGAFSQVALFSLNSFRKLFIAPSVESIERIATKPMKQMGDDDAITVWGFSESGKYHAHEEGVVDASPYVARVEAYLRLIKKIYVKKESKGGMENPRNKVPFMNLNGTMVDDSSRIIDALKNTFDVKVDAALTDQQLATGHLIQQTLFGSLYWVLLHHVFNTQEGRGLFVKDIALNMPPGIATIVTKYVLRGQNSQLQGSGIGKLPHAGIVKKGEADLKAISTILGKNKYILGTDEPTSYDCDLYAFLVPLFTHEMEIAFPWIIDSDKQLPNLMPYLMNMRNTLYPELSKASI